MRPVKNNKSLRFILSGGGTGGHIFQAIAIADELKQRYPDAEFLFVGATGKMEMEKVPQAGYKIVGLPITGLQRKLSWQNVLFPIRLLRSIWQSRQIVRDFQPDAAIGTGGYAGGPVIYAAAKMGIPTLIHEPNAFAGLANKWLGKYVDIVCVGFLGMERFFPAEKIVVTGNPVRESLLDEAIAIADKKQGETKSILLMGGSGGAKSLNEAMRDSTAAIAAQPATQWVWQCGKYYFEEYKNCATAQLPNVRIAAFVDKMDVAYGQADLVIGRSGATTIAEIQYLGKPSILVPSPWVADDHQTKNAEALLQHQAALLVADADTQAKLVNTALDLVNNEKQLAELATAAAAMKQSGAVKRIVDRLSQEIGLTAAEPKAVPKDQVYFIGIGGIGMSALARYYHSRGWKVSGYDRTETALTKQLAAEGMAIHYDARPEALPLSPEEIARTLFVYTPAVPANFPELVALRAAGVELLKRSAVLGQISKDKKAVAIAGTHGKTTTTTLTTHLLKACGIDSSAFLGGIARNFEGNYVHGQSDWVVVEADEYDRSFLQLYPQQAVILSMDADHLDIYGDHQNMLESGFMAFARQVNTDGCLLVRHDLVEQFDAINHCAILTFGIEEGDYRSRNIRVEHGLFTFDFEGPNGIWLEGLQLPLPGRHNVENTTAAIAMVIEAGGDTDQIASALLRFKGIARRFETVLKTDQLVVIDDYAHHPTELRAAIEAARELYPDKPIRGLFQPHLFSRTRDFLAGFAEALDLLDETVLLPIYPAREEPIEGISSERIAEQMQKENTQVLSKTAALAYLATQDQGVWLLLGAGDIDALVEPIVEQYQKAAQHD